MLTGYVYKEDKNLRWLYHQGSFYINLQDISKWIGRYPNGLSYVCSGVNNSYKVFVNRYAFVRIDKLNLIEKTLEHKNKYEYNLYIEEIKPLLNKIQKKEKNMEKPKGRYKSYTFQDVNDVKQTIHYTYFKGEVWFNVKDFTKIVGIYKEDNELKEEGVNLRKVPKSTLINKTSIDQLENLVVKGEIYAENWDNKDAILHLLGNKYSGGSKNSSDFFEKFKTLKPYYIVGKDITDFEAECLVPRGYSYAKISTPPFGNLDVMYNILRTTPINVQTELKEKMKCQSTLDDIKAWVKRHYDVKQDIQKGDIKLKANQLGCNIPKFYTYMKEMGYCQLSPEVWTLKQEKLDSEPMFLPEPQPETKTIRYKELVSSKGWWLFKNEVWEVKSIEILASEVESFKGTIENTCEIIEII